MLAAYPDYGKAPPEYLVTITELLRGYPISVQERLANVKTGIPAKCSFLPTVADIVSMADSLMANDAKMARYDEIAQRRPELPQLGYERKGCHCPFPKLEAAFVNETHLLRQPFEVMDNASRLLAVQGREAAHSYLSSRVATK